MTPEEAQEKVIANAQQRRENASLYSLDHGCHGIIGGEDETNIIKAAITEFRALIDGKEVPDVKRYVPESRGRYVNNPPWA